MQAQTFPVQEDTYLNDYANMIPGGLESRMRLKLQALKLARDIELTVLTINSMADYDHDGEIEPFATDLFNTWGIGDANRNDGVLLLVSRQDRKLRIEVGSGYGTSLNAEMKQIIDNTITPEFRKNAYYAGIDAGVNKIIYAVTDRYPGEYDSNVLMRIVYASIRFVKATFWWITSIGSPFALYFGIKGYRHWKRTKPRYCPKDGSKMYWLTEEDEDKHLTKGQIIEEEIESMDYDVWACRECDYVRLDLYPPFSSSYKLCPGCSYNTQYINIFHTQQPGNTTSGKGITRRQCKHCDHTIDTPFSVPSLQQQREDRLREEERRRRSSNSSSGSSGSSSRGGGRSSGGGASGSW